MAYHRPAKKKPNVRVDSAFEEVYQWSHRPSVLAITPVLGYPPEEPFAKDHIYMSYRTNGKNPTALISRLQGFISAS